MRHIRLLLAALLLVLAWVAGAAVGEPSRACVWIEAENYEEIEHQPPGGHGDPADVWAAAEAVYLARQLLLAEASSKHKRQ